MIHSLTGDLMDEPAVLEWLIANRAAGDGEDVIEEADTKTLETMISTLESIAVLYCKAKQNSLICSAI